MSRRPSALPAAPALVALLAVAGCTSTQEKADRLADRGKDAFTEQGVRVTRENPDVRVVDRAVVQDQNGTAAVVVLRNRGRRAQAAVPVAIDVRGAGRKSLFRNDAPGLEPSLTTMPVLAPGASTVWVNDQVTPTAKPTAVAAKVGGGKGAPKRVPRLKAIGVKLSSSSTGLQARGRVRNDSKVEQRDLVLYGVARKGGDIVAAGRAQVRRVRARSRASFRMFFIGDPRGARLQIDVPPTRLTD